MRLFVEAVLEPSALDEVWSVGQRMQGDASFPSEMVRWVKREAMHLTLRFLGEVEIERLEDVSDALGALEGCGRFALRIGEIGSFGGRRPRVVWVGFARDEGFDRLQQLHDHLDQALIGAGLGREEGAYRPHLTLGRVRRQATRRDLAAIRSAVDAAPSLEITTAVEQVALVESTLLRDGPRYRRLAIVEL